MTISQEIAGFFTAYAFETIALTGAATGLTASNYKPDSSQTARDLGKARLVFITVEGDVRYTVDGTTPVGATTGHLLADGSSLTLGNYLMIQNAKFIKNSSNAKLQVTYMR